MLIVDKVLVFYKEVNMARVNIKDVSSRKVVKKEQIFWYLKFIK